MDYMAPAEQGYKTPGLFYTLVPHNLLKYLNITRGTAVFKYFYVPFKENLHTEDRLPRKHKSQIWAHKK